MPLARPLNFLRHLAKFLVFYTVLTVLFALLTVPVFAPRQEAMLSYFRPANFQAALYIFLALSHECQKHERQPPAS